MALTYANAALAISTTAENSDLDLAGFQGLIYTPIGSIGSVGEWRTTDNIINYETVTDDVAQKQKGIANAGDPEVECTWDASDAGQLAMVAARGTSDAYAFRLTLSDGSDIYSRGLVAGTGVAGGGRREDFVLRRFTLGLVQTPVEDV
jgi:hypothetical protein